MDSHGDFYPTSHLGHQGSGDASLKTDIVMQNAAELKDRGDAKSSCRDIDTYLSQQ